MFTVCRVGKWHRTLNCVQCNHVAMLAQCQHVDSTLLDVVATKSVITDRWPSMHLTRPISASLHCDIWNDSIKSNLICGICFTAMRSRGEIDAFTSRAFWQLTIEPCSTVSREPESTAHHNQLDRSLYLNKISQHNFSNWWGKLV